MNEGKLINNMYTINTLNNNNEQNKSNNMNFMVYSQKKIPNIKIIPNNTETIEISKSNKDYRKAFFKQKTLNATQGKNQFLNSNIAAKSKRKQSINYVRSHLLINNNINNYGIEDYNNMIKTPKNLINILKDDNLSKSNEKSINFNRKYHNTIIVSPYAEVKIKDPDDFQVSEEDRMFNQYTTLKVLKKKKEKKEKTVKIKLKKKLVRNFFNITHNPVLAKVYKKMPQIFEKIEDTKKLKYNMSLLKYQNLLMNVGTKNLNLETKQKLHNKFKSLRSMSNRKYSLFQEYLQMIEEKEEKIIKSINTQQDFYKKEMKKSRYNTFSATRIVNDFGLPNLKFYKIGGSKKMNRKSIFSK